MVYSQLLEGVFDRLYTKYDGNGNGSLKVKELASFVKDMYKEHGYPVPSKRPDMQRVLASFMFALKKTPGMTSDESISVSRKEVENWFEAHFNEYFGSKKNRLLIRHVVGHSADSSYDLPPKMVKYGKPLSQDPEGAGAVALSWVKGHTKVDKSKEYGHKKIDGDHVGDIFSLNKYKDNGDQRYADISGKKVKGKLPLPRPTRSSAMLEARLKEKRKEASEKGKKGRWKMKRFQGVKAKTHNQ